MNSLADNPTYQLSDIKAALASDARAFIEAQDRRYEQEIIATADRLSVSGDGRSIVMMAGPSSVGKTTTANKLCAALKRRGRDAWVVSLDDFYIGRRIAPKLPNGEPDFESIRALNTDLLVRCISDLLTSGRTKLPTFDFVEGVSHPDTRELILPPSAVVIFEGIHTFNPIFTGHFQSKNIEWVFVNTLTRMADGDEVLLNRRQLRLIRRLIRDEIFRASTAAFTLRLWELVLAAEETYIFPFVPDTELAIDTTLAYEPCVLKRPLLELLDRSDPETLKPYRERIDRLREGIARFPELSPEALTKESLVHEFIG